MTAGDWVAVQFEESRPRLRAIAHRMLGSETEAEDAVQEVWLRLSRAGPEGIDNLGGWLTTVVSRVCLDILRSRRSRPEEPVGADPPEAVSGHVFSDAADGGKPEHDVLLADSIGPALLVVLDSLDPDERLAFVLHDLFGVPFGEIAPIVGRSPAATRQLASRARRRLQGRSASGLSRPKPFDRRQSELVDAFLAASRQGDFEALFALLDPDVLLRSDPVAVRAATARQAQGAPPLSPEVSGRDAVARIFAGRAAGAQGALVDGAPGAVVLLPGGRPLAAFVMRWREGKIVEIELVADPRRLRTLELVF
jgi:RNA polymerase sigma factor (sigma-70 family)